jgi:hypothetical protein
MPRFWLATYMAPPSQAAHESPAAVLLAAGARYLAIEVLGDAETSEYAVLFSTVDDPKRPRALTCLIAFANGAKACSIWRDRGVPLVDARIVSDGAGTISVFSPLFR